MAENINQQKIYFQDEKITIGNKVWEFVGNDVSQPSFKRKKTIPVNAISSVDFVYAKIGWCWTLIVLGGILLVLGILSYFLLLRYLDLSSANDVDFFISCFNIFDGIDNIIYYFPIIGVIILIWGIKAKNNRKNIGKIQVVTNNNLSGYDYDGLYDYEADKYLEPMRQCLLEKEN